MHQVLLVPSFIDDQCVKCCHSTWYFGTVCSELQAIIPRQEVEIPKYGQLNMGVHLTDK